MRSLPPELDQTCYGCVRRLREKITDSLGMFALLPAELLAKRAETALVMLSPGSNGTAQPRCVICGQATPLGAGMTCRACSRRGTYPWGSPGRQRQPMTYVPATAEHAAFWEPIRPDPGTLAPWEQSTGHGLHLRDDPYPPATVFGWWEDDWRGLLGAPAALVVATMASTTNYLLMHLSWAAQNHPAWLDFADDVRDIHRRLEDATSHGERMDRSDAPCLDCDATELRRAYAPPDRCDHAPYAFPWWHRLLQRQWFEQHVGPDGSGCDQGGLRQVWECGACGRRYEPAEYWRAVHQRYWDQRAAQDLEAQA